MKNSGKKSIKRPLMIAALVVFCVVFAVSGGVTVYQSIRYARDDEAFDGIKSNLPRADYSYIADVADGAGGTVAEEPGEETEPEKQPIVRMSTNGRYDELYAQNPDMYGWITIEDTRIDYPVMYTPEDPEYYLHRSFEKKYSISGVPFIDGDCDAGCYNYIIYGHHMDHGSMFSALLDYKDEEFCKEHSRIIFDTIEEHGEYEVIAAFSSKVYKKAEDGVFIWYNYTDLSDEEDFNEYIAGINSLKLYDTGVSAEYGDELVTLSTCGKNSSVRFVVVAKRVV